VTRRDVVEDHVDSRITYLILCSANAAPQVTGLMASRKRFLARRRLSFRCREYLRDIPTWRNLGANIMRGARRRAGYRDERDLSILIAALISELSPRISSTRAMSAKIRRLS